MRRRLAAATVGAVLIAAAVLAFSLGKHPVTAGSNTAAPLLPAVAIHGGQTRCQEVSRVPAGVTHVRVVTSAIGGRPGRFEITLSEPGGGPATAGGGRIGLAGKVIRLDSPVGGLHPARACMRYLGGGDVVLAGERKRVRSEREASGAVKHGVASLLFLRPGLSSWASRRGVIADRYANSQADPLGEWTLWVAVLAALGAGLLALCWVAFRLEPRREPS
jgi:hypothetical protein